VLIKISTCCVAVISNSTVYDVCVFHAAVFGEMKLFMVLNSVPPRIFGRPGGGGGGPV